MSLVEAESVQEVERNHKGQLAPGTRLNPHGRPKGGRNKLSEAFIADLLDTWQTHGMDVIERVIATEPGQYLRVIASLLPKDVNISVRQLDDLTDEQLIQRLRQVTEQAKPLLMIDVTAEPQRNPNGDVVDAVSNHINELAKP